MFIDVRETGVYQSGCFFEVLCPSSVANEIGHNVLFLS